MKSILKFFLLLVVTALLILPGSALAAGPGEAVMSVQPDEFVFGNNYTLENGQTLSGNLWVFGGNVDLRENSRVTGSIMVFGGNIRVNGQVEGSINVAGGNVDLRESSTVRGNVSVMGGSLSRDRNSRVEGEIDQGSGDPFSFNFPRGVPAPRFNMTVNPFFEFMAFLFQAFLTAALAVLVVMFLPVQTQRVSQTATTQPLIAGGLGLVTMIAAPLLLILVITIILIPVVFLAYLLLAVMVMFGWIAVGLELGKRLAVLLKADWALPVAAGIGTLVLSVVAGGVGKYVWCIGWILPTAVAMVGLGSVLLTRFGTRPYPLYASPAPVRPVPVSPVASGTYQPQTGQSEGLRGGVGVYPLDDDHTDE